MRHLLPALAATLLWLSAAHAQRPGTATLTGQVRDAETAAPLDGLTVAVPDQNRSTMTDAEGRFVLRDLAAGDFIVTIAGLGYTPFSESRGIREGVHLDIELMPQPIEMEEVVVDIETIDEALQNRRNASGVSHRLLTAEDFSIEAYATVVDMLRFRIGIVSCPIFMDPNPAAGSLSESLQLSSQGMPACVHVRGRSVPIAVYIDEQYTMAGVGALWSYNPQEVYAIEIRRSGSEIRLFTKPFIERAMRETRMLSRMPSMPPGGPGG